VLLIFFLTILSFQVQSQSFQISYVPVLNYSFDKVTNDVYFADLGGNIFVRNLNDFSLNPSPFPNLPEFAHNTHSCAYGEGDTIFVYDFSNNKKTAVYSPAASYDYSFSPDDEYLLLRGKYYSFADSTIHDMEFSPAFYFDYDWVSETKLLISLQPGFLYSYDFLSNEVDTVFFEYEPGFSSFAYNREQDLLYYGEYEDIRPEIHTYNLNSLEDSVVFDPEINDPDDICWRQLNYFDSMKWSSDFGKLAILSFVLEAGGTICVFEPDTRKFYRYTDCGGEGFEYYLKWLGPDTIAYINYTNASYLYGYALDHPVSVEEIPENVSPSEFKVSAYPNPFNGTIKISLNGELKEPEVIIYNINGEEVKRYEELQHPDYRFNIVWDGTNGLGQVVSSGIYLIVVFDKQDPLEIKGTLKVSYIK